MFVKIEIFSPKSIFLSKIEYLCQKSKIFVQNRIFFSKIELYLANFIKIMTTLSIFDQNFHVDINFDFRRNFAKVGFQSFQTHETSV